jgi:hypothetical protein
MTNRLVLSHPVCYSNTKGVKPRSNTNSEDAIHNREVLVNGSR